MFVRDWTVSGLLRVEISSVRLRIDDDPAAASATLYRAKSRNRNISFSTIRCEIMPDRLGRKIAKVPTESQTRSGPV